MRNRSLLAALPLLLVAGCGGGSSSGGTPTPGPTGRGLVPVTWPDRNARFIPYAANSVKVSLELNGVAAGTQVLKRVGDGASTATVVFEGLKYGHYDIKIKAYPTDDATGTPQATGNGAMDVSEDEPGSAGVSLATTVKTISILPISIFKRGTSTVNLSALDEDSNIVLLQTGHGAEKVVWSVDTFVPADKTVATLSVSDAPSVVLTGTHSGTAKLKASLTLGGVVKTATADVEIKTIDDGSGTITVS